MSDDPGVLGHDPAGVKLFFADMVDDEPFDVLGGVVIPGTNYVDLVVLPGVQLGAVLVDINDVVRVVDSESAKLKSVCEVNLCWIYKKGGKLFSLSQVVGKFHNFTATFHP